MTTDQTILSWISGYEIPFTRTVYQKVVPVDPKRSKNELEQLSHSISQLIKKGAIRECTSENNQFLSSFFLRPKPDGTNRFILNLKKLNEFLEPIHFKLEDARTSMKLIQKNCFMATIDIKDAYYLIPIAESNRKYLRFSFADKIYEFLCLPFGLSTAPFVFTKIMKAVIKNLRHLGYSSVIYLDDIMLLGNSYSECVKNVQRTCGFLEKLGFIITKEKSKLKPSNKCKFLGFTFDSKRMVIELPEDKKVKTLEKIETFRLKKKCKIREFAKFIGILGSCCLAFTYGWVHMKDFEREKYLALKANDNNFEAVMVVSNNLMSDLQWWKKNILTGYNPIGIKNFVLEIFSDASKSGWGACCRTERTHGFWNDMERNFHINLLELQSSFFGLKCFASHLKNCNILLRIDNTTAIAYINRMGGIQFMKLSSLAKKIWEWCEIRNVWIFASYISSEENNHADFESRRLEPETEFELSNEAFKILCKKLGRPEIDLFATRINFKCKKYISWFKDPGSWAVDAFTVCWKPFFFYAFPPFAIILKVLQKISMERSTGIVVVPYWTTQPWFPFFVSLQISELIIFKPNKNLLRSSNREPHPLWKTITLVAATLSGGHLP